MEGWLHERGKPALFQAFNEAWSRLENDYQDACNAENTRVADVDGELRALKARIAKADWLEQQNKTLKEEIDQLKKPSQKHQRHQQENQTPAKTRPEVRTPLAPLSVNQPRNLGTSVKHAGNLDINSLSRDELSAEYIKLEDKYHTLRSRFSDNVEANEKLQKQFRENKQAFERWTQYAKKLEEQSNARKQKIEKLKTRLAVATSGDAGANVSFASDTHSVENNNHDPNDHEPEQAAFNYINARTPSPPGALSDVNRDSSITGSTDGTERAPSLPPLPVAGTKTAHQSPMKEPSSDTPIIVSERSVHKRRRNDDTLGQIPAATRIKREEGSDPVVTSELRHFVAHESVDFDNAEERVVTPRKTRITHSTSQMASQTAIKEQSPSREDSVHMMRSQSPDAFTSHGSMSAHVQEREKAAAQWRKNIFPDQSTQDLDYDEPPSRPSVFRVSDTLGSKPGAGKSSPKIITPSLRKGIASLAEDGNNTRHAPDTPGQHAVKGGRLANLLNSAASPGREAIALPSGTRGNKTPARHAFLLAMPEKRDLPFGRSGGVISEPLAAPETPSLANSKRIASTGTGNRTPLDTSENPKSKKDKPLRERPIWSLKRADFKVNPKYNEGYDYAFNEVVRGHERASLPACIREECCGKVYRPLAEAALPDAGHVAFTSLLEYYLGDDAYKLGSMTKEEKQKMWIEAKIREIAQTSGRHRERHAGLGHDELKVQEWWPLKAAVGDNWISIKKRTVRSYLPTCTYALNYGMKGTSVDVTWLSFTSGGDSGIILRTSCYAISSKRGHRKRVTTVFSPEAVVRVAAASQPQAGKMNHHLPAGQPMPGGVGGMGGRGMVDMGPGPAPHTGNGPRRRPQYPHQQHSYTHPNHNQPIYYQNSHMNPYANAYYPPAPPHYQNAAMPGSPYGMPYNHNPYAARSPPAIHQQYAPIVSSSMAHTPQPYSRPPQQPSPAISTPPPFHIAQPPPPAPIPQTPSSTHSSQAVQAPLTPQTPQSQEVPVPPQTETEVVPAKAPFAYPLPWLSDPDSPFPTRAARSRRRRRILTTTNGGVELPANQQAGIETLAEPAHETTVPDTPTQPAAPTHEPTASAESVERPETPSTQDLPSESAQSTSPTTPASVHTEHASTVASVTPTKPIKSTKTAVPAVPVVPILPKSSPKETRTSASTEKPATEQRQAADITSGEKVGNERGDSTTAETSETKAEAAPAPVKTAPKSWASLLAGNAASAPSAAARNTAAANGAGTANGAAVGDTAAVAGFAKSNVSSQAEALHDFAVNNGSKVAFLEPRGLINTGNMCYMNSVLQVLIFCMPFYDFLDQVSKKAAHSFNSETPLIDAIIMFMREYKVIDSATSVDQLRRRLKNEELEQYGEPFTPEFVYEAIRKLPRFASMRRGHQQDAEEFLGFLLEALHDECASVLRHLPDASAATTAANSSAASPTVTTPTESDSNAWLEVGRKQRPAVTRSSGHPVTSSPITKIFGGQLRSELRVSGLKDSVTLEPYQPLQLDIDSPQVRNIVDALKNITRIETLTGDFGSPRGRDGVAHKQVFIESLPPVLILHLKRFQFDAKGGTMKIWKKVGYPLELEIPAEVISRHKRAAVSQEFGGVPKYKLIAAVYHHGKNASGGHYTVDVRRQDGREWVRIDDTVIRRVRSEDVAEGGAEEDKKAWSDDRKEAAVGGSGNRFEGIGDDAGDDEGWNKVSAPAGGAKKWSSIVNGGANPPAPAPKPVKDNKADNKVAYLLFYQRV
ncbi:putative USP domain-containing protein [Seiridium cardinale]|uniref:ubiquitinyl hydrolase 1 n=1 Tax=Seiridium cardinale TaxID=138064 RepID=A0ABR2Y7W0_9PEZI